MIKIVLFDVDGCIIPGDKTVLPIHEDLSSEMEMLNRLAMVIAKRKGLVFSFCTTRSLASGVKVAEILGLNGYSAFENGNVIYNPLSGESYLLVNKDEKFNYLAPVLRSLQAWCGTIDDLTLAYELGIKPENLRRLRDRKSILTYEILPFDKPPVSGEQLWAVLKEKFLTKEMAGYLQRGELNVIPSASALDVGIGIDKEDAIKHILGIYGISGEDALSIGDSFHSDYAMFKVTGYRGVPSNAHLLLKKTVRDYPRGHVSERPMCEGVLDILQHFLD